MSLHDGDFGNARGRREAFENRDAIERRARIEAASASAVRDRLEKGSPSWARRNFAGMLNELVRRCGWAANCRGWRRCEDPQGAEVRLMKRFEDHNARPGSVHESVPVGDPTTGERLSVQG